MMVTQEHESLLNDTQRTQGRSALRNNVAAATALAGAVRSTLGPKGLDKMLVSGGDNHATVTNDGVTVLENAQVEHPTAKMLIAQSSAQDRQAGDGTTTTVILTAELLQNALELIDIGVHPGLVGRGYRLANSEIMKELSNLSKEATEEDSLKSVMTSLSGKSDEGVREHLSKLAVKAAKSLTHQVDGRIDADATLVKKIHDMGRPSVESELISGLVLAKDRLHSEMKMYPKGGSILILDGGISRRKPDIDINLKVTDTGMIAALNAQELRDIQNRVDAIATTGCNLLCVRDGIDDDARGMLLKAGITCYRRIEKPDLELLARTTGSTIVHEPMLARSEDLGKFTSLTSEKWGGVTYMKLVGASSAGLTLVVRGTSKTRMDEVARGFDDAIGVACGLVCEPRVLPGGGATQMALARHLRKFAPTVPGREQLAIEAFAGALEAIPRILSENAGLSPLDELLRLNAAQEVNGPWTGLNIFNGQTAAMDEVGIIEPLAVSKNAISGAMEAAVSVLRIDDVLWANQDPSIPDWEKSDGSAGET
ncbi:MAG TPA: thermosome subunit alpha [Candidatus Thalassarchaeaceae archaeon]|nr:thermosome subunit alpha [Candidatus Thalassarchaeaceae archaeon]